MKEDPGSIIQHHSPHSIPLGVLCAEAGVGCPPAAAHMPIHGISADSRRIRPGWLFVAIRGMHTDAARFIRDAVSRGCAAVVYEGSVPDGDPVPVPLLSVPDGRAAMAYLFDAWYGHPGRRLRLVGVTGTNGKTSVSSMLCHILTNAGIPCGIIGTVGCRLPDGSPLPLTAHGETAHMTTPDPEELYGALAAMADRGEGHPRAVGSCGKPTVVMEVTSHALALGKVEPLHFDMALFTNLTPDHLDLHGDMAAYAAAKTRLFAQTRVGVVNAADAYGRCLLTHPLATVDKWLICHPDRGMVAPPGIHEIRCHRPCERIYAGQICLQGADGISYRMVSPTARLRVACPVPGSFTVENSLLAAAAALDMGVPPATVKRALASFRGVCGRMERVVLPSNIPYAVFIDFAHTPDALEHLLTTVRDFWHEGERIVLLFGCGGDRDPSKRGVMGRMAVRLADHVVVTSDNCRTEDPDAIIQDILSGIPSEDRAAVTVIRDRARAIAHVMTTARPGDIILLAGKGHEAYEIDRDGVHPFCEREMVQRMAASQGDQK